MGRQIEVTGALLALGVFVQGAQAQEGGASVALPTIVVSPTTLPTPIEEVGSSVTVLTQADIERTQRRTIPDLLNTVPGLHVVQNGSPGTQTSVFMRGTNSNHVKVFIDGVDVGDSSTPNGAIDFGQLMTADLERVEVLRGPQSGLYGANAIGGVISLTTKKGAGPAKATGYLEGGSFGTFNQAAGFSGSVDRFNYAFNASHFRATGMPVTPGYMVPPGGQAFKNSYDNQTYSTRLGYDVNDMLTFNAYGRYADGELRYTNDDPNTFPGVTYRDQSTYRAKTFTGRLESVVTLLDGRFVNTFGANYTDHDRSNKDPDPNVPTTYKGSRDKYDWRGKFALTPEHNVVAGLERETERATTSDVSASTGNTGGFVELQSAFARRLFVVANVRRDNHDAFGGHTTWRIAPAFIVPVTNTKLKASYGTGFKAPTLYQLYGVGSFGFRGNPGLMPETSRGYDFGFEQPMPDDRFRVGITYFRNDIENLIDYNATFTSLINISQAETHGIEAFGALTFNEQLGARLDYTYTVATNAVTGAQLLRRPRDKLSLSAVWRPLDKLTISPTVIYLGKWMDVDRATFAQRQAGGVTIVNLAADYVVNDNVTVFARVDNLFNKIYENPLGWEQPGLGVYGGIRLTSR